VAHIKRVGTSVRTAPVTLQEERHRLLFSATDKKTFLLTQPQSPAQGHGPA
jgi:hypothetical protein